MARRLSRLLSHLRERLERRQLFVLLTATTVLAIGIVTAVALRSSFQLDRAREDSLLQATLRLAEERIDRVERFLLDQDGVLQDHLKRSDHSSLQRRWLASAARETPTVEALFVLDLSADDREVNAHIARQPSVGDNAMRYALLRDWLPRMDLSGGGNVRHLHLRSSADGDLAPPLLLSYWVQGTSLVVGVHNLERMVSLHLPRLFALRGDTKPESDVTMSILDEKGRLVFGSQQRGGDLIGRGFPSTLTDWQLQLSLNSSGELRRKIEQQRWLERVIVVIAALAGAGGFFVVMLATLRQRRLTELKTELVANVSHELKTPLALIRMFAEMLGGDRPLEAAKAKQYLDIIVRECDRLTGIIQNLLDFARFDGNTRAIELQAQAIDPLIHRVCEALDYRFRQHQVTLRPLVEANLPLALVDPIALELVLTNLLDNALKYATGTTEVRICVARRKNRVVVRVEDDGPGIASSDQERVLERFERGTGAHTGRVRGSGIGLSLVREVARLHGSEVRIESPYRPAPHTGTAFSIALRCVSNASAPTGNASTSPAASSASER